MKTVSGMILYCFYFYTYSATVERISRQDCVVKVCTGTVTKVEIWNLNKWKNVSKYYCYKLNDALCYVHIKAEFMDQESYKFRMTDDKYDSHVSDTLYFGKVDFEIGVDPAACTEQFRTQVNGSVFKN